MSLCNLPAFYLPPLNVSINSTFTRVRMYLSSRAEDKQDALFQVKDLYSKYKLSDYASSIKYV